MPDAKDPAPTDFRDICFVIMPHGKRKIGTGKAAREVDFDAVYRDVFEPGISAVPLPKEEGGGCLRPIRADRDFHTGHIGQAMFEYVEYSRFALADITGLNANVFYELSARHRAHESGTAIFRQRDAPISFDIHQIRAFPYSIEPIARIDESRKLVEKVLRESLERNAWDSPIMLALRAQRNAGKELQGVLLEAGNAVREGDFKLAHDCWLRASQLDPENPRHDLKAGVYPKAEGDWDSVIRLLRSALDKESKIGPPRAESSYSDAYRELGIAQNKRDGKVVENAGEENLRRAVHYAPTDYDAWASLGGVLRRAGELAQALECYERAVEVSDGHPYPLLMAIKLRAKISGKWAADAQMKKMIGKALDFRKAQTQYEPPIDVPWSFFDLAEIHLYRKEGGEALDIAEEGLALCTAKWMPETFLSALQMLPEGEDLPSLPELKEKARRRMEAMPG